jgi:hypothetical protein
VRNGKDAPDIRRSQPPSTRDDSVQNKERQAQPPYGYPPPYPTDPKERERFDKMMEQYGPPPGYYPPQGNYPPPGYPPQNNYPPQGQAHPQDNVPSNNQEYEAPYDYGEQYFDEYDQDYYDYDSKLERNVPTDRKAADAHRPEPFGDAYDDRPSIGMHEDYGDDDWDEDIP